jgi:hypothetical protein
MSAETPDLLRDRLVLAALNALTEGDPFLVIGVSDNEIRLGWVDGVTDTAALFAATAPTAPTAPEPSDDVYEARKKCGYE